MTFLAILTISTLIVALAMEKVERDYWFKKSRHYRVLLDEADDANAFIRNALGKPELGGGFDILANAREVRARVKHLEMQNAELESRNERQTRIITTSPTARALMVAQFSAEPMECGHAIECWNENTGVCDFCAALEKAAKYEKEKEDE